MPNKGIKQVRLTCIVLVILIMLAVVDIGAFFLLGIHTPCLFREITGLKCVGCGMSHALMALTKLDFASAFQYNALSITVVPACGVYLLYRILMTLKGKANRHYKAEYIILGIMLAICLVFGIVRNL